MLTIKRYFGKHCIPRVGCIPSGFALFDIEGQKDIINEACIGVLGIQDICHFTFRDIGYFPFYFQGYRILCSIFWSISGILNI